MKFCSFAAAIAAVLLSQTAFAQFTPGPTPLGQGPAAPSSSAPAMSGKTVVATVAGISVTLEDFQKLLDNAPAQILQYAKQNPQQFIQQMFLFRYLTSEGDKNKLGERSPLKEQIDAQRNWIIANAMVNEEQNRYAPSEEELQSFYKSNQSRWEAAKIRAIVIGFKPGQVTGTTPDQVAEAAKRAFENEHPLNARSEAEAVKLAADLVKQLRAGADFAEYVKKYSDDPISKDGGGEFPPIKATSSFAEDFKKSVFAMKAGDIGEPLRQNAALYIIRLDEKSVEPYKDVVENITQELKANHRNLWLTDLNKRFNPAVVRQEFFLQPEKYLKELAIPQGAAPKQ
jgi:parvulin-like peptidyl-prolyl isomerase